MRLGPEHPACMTPYNGGVGISDIIGRMLNGPAVADPSRGAVALEGSAPMGKPRNHEYDVAYRAAHRAELAAKQMAYWKAHPEVSAAYEAANREKILARMVAYRQARREERVVEKQAYADAHREELEAQARAHQDELRARRRARAAIAAAERRVWNAAHRDEIAAKFAARKFGEVVPLDVWRFVWSGECFGCGKTPAEGVDHIIPFVHGGRNIESNIHPACPACNRRKGRFERRATDPRRLLP
jgi:5-methylcytosine-specific restriction endonuclease McrA